MRLFKSIANPKFFKLLGHESSEPITYNVTQKEDGFYLFSFPEADEYEFSEIVKLLKLNGITTIGADTQLTERNIMKLTNLIKEQGSPDENNLIDILKNAVERMEDSNYRGGGMESCEKSDHYLQDIKDIIEDYEEEEVMNRPDTTDISEISKYKLKDLILQVINEQE